MLVALLAVGAALLGAAALVSSSSPATTPDPAASDESPAPPPRARSRKARRAALGAAGGALPDGTSVFDDAAPGVARLDPELLRALRQAATDAGDDVAFDVTSGWRSPAYQARLLREAVATYGSEEEAARWVATPETSAHVSGDAVDVGPPRAAAWLSERGAAYGLCRVYDNEPWHFELRPAASERGCPATYADPTRDPRMAG